MLLAGDMLSGLGPVLVGLVKSVDPFLLKPDLDTVLVMSRILGLDMYQ